MQNVIMIPLYASLAIYKTRMWSLVSVLARLKLALGSSPSTWTGSNFVVTFSHLISSNELTELTAALPGNNHLEWNCIHFFPFLPINRL